MLNHSTVLCAAMFCSVLTLGVADTALADRPTAIDTTRSDTIQLRHTLSTGTTGAYVLTLERRLEVLEDDPLFFDVSISMPFRYEVQSLDAAGIGTVATVIDAPTIDDPPVTGFTLFDQEAETVLDGTRFTWDVRTDGRVMATTGRIPRIGLVGDDVQDALVTRWIEFPVRPVAIGDTWVQSFSLWLAEEHAGLTAVQTGVMTLAGYAEVDGVEHAVIDISYSREATGEMIVDWHDDEEPLALQIHMRTEATGYILFDHQAGIVTEIQIEDGTVYVVADASGVRESATVEGAWTIIAD